MKTFDWHGSKCGQERMPLEPVDPAGSYLLGRGGRRQ